MDLMKVNKELKAPLKQQTFNDIQQKLSITPENLDVFTTSEQQSVSFWK